MIEKYARQSGGKGQYGHVKINIYPNKDKGYEFVNNIVGGAIPKEYIRLLTRVFRAQCSAVLLQATM